jgi:hypothetical protein
LDQTSSSAATCLDFDFAVVDFWDWYERTREERVKARQSKAEELSRGQVWAPKYKTVEAILALYGATDGEGVAHDDTEFDDVDMDALFSMFTDGGIGPLI